MAWEHRRRRKYLLGIWRRFPADQATLNGQGIALLDCNMLSDLLKGGQLVPFSQFEPWVRGSGWHLVFVQGHQIEETVTALIDWMMDEVATSDPSRQTFV